MRMAVLALAFLAAALPAQAGDGAGKPQRIVSLYLCADLYLMQLVERERILSLSHLSRDGAVSMHAGEIEDIPVNYGTAEEALALEPDLVMAGPFAFRSRTDLLERLGAEVVSLGHAETLEDIREETLRIAAILGEPERGRALVARMDRTLDRVRARGGPAAEAAVYISGVAIGRGTLFDRMLASAGLTNLADRLGMDGYSYLSMEALVHARPDMLVIGSTASDRPSLAARRLEHPALRASFPGARYVVVPERYWTCPNPVVAEAIALLAEARRSLPDGPGADGS